jgi:hypothetical protein
VPGLAATGTSAARDPQFLADAGRMSIDVSPLPGAELQERVQKLYDTPKAILEQAKRAIRP